MRCSNVNYFAAIFYEGYCTSLSYLPRPTGVRNILQNCFNWEKSTLRDIEIELASVCAFGSDRDVFTIALITV